MKKLCIFSVLVLILLSFTYAADYNICIYPENKEISSYVNDYFVSNKTANISYKLVKNSISCSSDDLLTQDPRLLEYICNKNKINLLLIPVIEKISDYNYMRLYSYDFKEKNFELVYEIVDSEKTEFGFDVIKAVNNHLIDSQVEIIEKKQEDFNLEQILSDHSLIINCSNTVADIYVNDEFVGVTPYTLENYYIPSVIKLSADGFADRVYAIKDSKTNQLTVSLIPDLKADSENFKKAQNKYYLSFAGAILGLGSRVMVKALNVSNPGVYKALDYTSKGLMVSSLAYLGFNIYQYFKTTQFTTP